MGLCPFGAAAEAEANHMSMTTRLKAKFDEWTAVPVCGDCGETMERFGYGHMCYQCVAQKIADEREADAAAEARRFAKAVLASAEYQALQDRITVLEIVAGKQFGAGGQDAL